VEHVCLPPDAAYFTEGTPSFEKIMTLRLRLAPFDRLWQKENQFINATAI
jgi:hypothetical protein